MAVELNHFPIHAESRAEKARVWVYEHPTAMKVIQVAALILGVAALASLAAVPFIGAAIVVPLAIAGAVLVLASTISLLALDIIVPPHHSMKNHVFKPGECEGGKLYYEGDVPILSLDSDDPLTAGKAHGYLCGEAINALSKRFGFVLHTLARMPQAENLPHTLAELRKKIPQEYLKEIDGLVEGYNKWAKENWWRCPKKLTADDALLFHLIPDSCHFQPGAFEKGFAQNGRRENIPLFACTAIVDKDPEKGFVFARNMDWPTFGVFRTLVINRKHENGLPNTVEVGVPGLVGTVTGMNSHGLSLAMNVCTGNTQGMRGMPASIYNRTCLEQCQTVQDVEEFTKKMSPLGPYHLTTADPNQAASIHFYQGEGRGHVTRRWEENHPLTTLNCRYAPEPNCPMHYSQQRQQQIDAFLQNRGNRPLEEALALPYVNNSITAHTIVMEPKTKTFKMAIDNAYSGRIRPHLVPTEALFDN